MKKAFLFLFINLTGALFSQLESIKIEGEPFLNPTLNSLSYLISNIDSVKYNQALLPLGFHWLPATKNTNLQEYKKLKNSNTQYVAFDAKYLLLTITWKDESGKNPISSALKKSLKGKEHTTPGCYKTLIQERNVIICIETKKEKAINEMITVEIVR